MESTLRSAVVDYIAHLKEARPLQTTLEAEAAKALVESLGLRSHHDTQKNWDTFKCIAYLASIADKQAPVLDAGSGAKLVAPQMFHALGFANIYACDVQGAKKHIYEPLGIHFTTQDLLATDYEDRFFEAVTCISVIEHNIDFTGFLREMSRLLRPGGYLLISTDYWSEPIDCSGIYPYSLEGGEMKIITPADLNTFVQIATGFGLELCEPLQFETTDKAVRWERTDRDYTFYFAAFRKRA